MCACVFERLIQDVNIWKKTVCRLKLQVLTGREGRRVEGCAQGAGSWERIRGAQGRSQCAAYRLQAVRAGLLERKTTRIEAVNF